MGDGLDRYVGVAPNLRYAWSTVERTAACPPLAPEVTLEAHTQPSMCYAVAAGYTDLDTRAWDTAIWYAYRTAVVARAAVYAEMRAVASVGRRPKDAPYPPPFADAGWFVVRRASRAKHPLNILPLNYGCALYEALRLGSQPSLRWRYELGGVLGPVLAGRRPNRNYMPDVAKGISDAATIIMALLLAAHVPMTKGQQETFERLRRQHLRVARPRVRSGVSGWLHDLERWGLAVNDPYDTHVYAMTPCGHMTAWARDSLALLPPPSAPLTTDGGATV